MSGRVRILAVATAVAVLVYWATDMPLGVPGEWVWNRIPHEVLIESVLGFVFVGLAGGLFGAIAYFGLGRIGAASRVGVTGWVSGLMLAGFVWLIAVQEAPPEGHRLSKGAWVLYYPAMTGYFHKARYEISDTASFLKGYEALMAEGDVLHVGTHPPGLFVMYRGLIGIADGSPGLVEVLNWSQPQSVRDSLDVIAENIRQRDRMLTEKDRAVLWCGVLLSHFSVCWVIAPLFALMCWSASREVAWKACCFWPLIPTVAIFLPKDDVLFCGLVVSFLWCWLQGTRSRRATAAIWGAVAGALGFCGLFLSLVFLPIGLIALLAGVLGYGRTTKADWREVARTQWPACLGGALAVGGLILVLRGVWGLDLIAVWRLNVRNHAAFYSQYARSYWKWLPVNAIELILALGVPLAMLVMTAIWRGLRTPVVARRASVIAVGAVWGFLWLSGKNSGEAARLWIPLMPLAVWLLPGILQAEDDDRRPALSDREWLWCLGLQAVACAATVTRVTGFHFGG